MSVTGEDQDGRAIGARQAAVTIVSNNYLPAARVLARSFKAHHPDARFFVVLVDEPVDGGTATDEPFERILFSELDLPDRDGFKVRYSVMELNTAVKPYVMEQVFSSYPIDILLYIDPDILVFRRLEAIWAALETGDIVLTPHMTQPYNDGFKPTEVDILRSGTYNLGFIGLRRSAAAASLLSWWKEKLFQDCIVDIPNGLFVDQKWMDLVPGYYPSTFILSDPAYNVAYWNLHERPLTYQNGQYFVRSVVPVAFFHFSGFSPLKPNELSKHQNRIRLEDQTAVRMLCDYYAGRLIDQGFLRDRMARYAFDQLPNGVPVSETIRVVVRELSDAKVIFPPPFTDADAFCEFICKPSPLSGSAISLVERAVLRSRPDVDQAFTGARQGKSQNFLEWISTNGRHEEKLGRLADFLLERDMRPPVAAQFFQLLRDAKRIDVARAYPNILLDRRQLIGLCQWAQNHGVEEHGLDADIEARLLALVDAPRRVMNLYFSRPDLQKGFPWLGDKAVLDAFCSWLDGANSADAFSRDEIEMFRGVAAWEPSRLNHLVANTNVSLRRTFGGMPTAFDYCDPSTELQHIATPDILNEEFASDEPLESQARRYLVNRKSRGQAPLNLASAEFLPLDAPAPAAHFLLPLRAALKTALSESQRPTINVAGYFAAPTGVGEAARSLVAAARSVGLEVNEFIIPSPIDQGDLKTGPYPFGRPAAEAALSISVINADMIEATRPLLPEQFWGSKNVAVWFWETDRLPASYAQVAERFDEIWVATKAVARAVRASVRQPVKVIPLCLDFEALGNARADRERFGLPQDALIYSFFFDLNSIIARKNPGALIRAFESAFGNDPSKVLVLKTNAVRSSSFSLEAFRVLTKRDNIILIEETLDRGETYDLLMSTDVYCSLHRFEGFGLTCAEAMALGKPVIATGYSGNVDFMDSQTSILAPCLLTRTTTANGPYPAGTLWAEPLQAAVVESMKALTDKAYREILGRAAQVAIRERLDPRVVGARLSAAAADLALRDSRVTTFS